jgi:hypothetical protein
VIRLSDVLAVASAGHARGASLRRYVTSVTGAGVTDIVCRETYQALGVTRVHLRRHLSQVPKRVAAMTTLYSEGGAICSVSLRSAGACTDGQSILDAVYLPLQVGVLPTNRDYQPSHVPNW